MMTAAFVKKAPKIEDPKENMETVSQKVNMLQTVITNLTNKFSEETRLLREESKSIRSEIKNMMPAYSDLFKRRETVILPSNSDNRDTTKNIDRPARKRTRTEEGTVEDMEVVDEVFDSGFQKQNRRGFLSKNDPNRQLTPETRNNQNKARTRNWKNSLPNVTGNSSEKHFVAPVDLFVFNVNRDVTELAIVDHMKSKGLGIIQCEQKFHQEARTKSFLVKVRA